MLRTSSTWTAQIGSVAAVEPFSLVYDLDDQQEFDTVPVTPMSHPSLPSRPYVYGKQLTAAARLRNAWNRSHPADPMP